MSIIQSKLPRFGGSKEECTLMIDTVYTLPLSLGASKIVAGTEAIMDALKDYLILCVNANVSLVSSDGDGLAYVIFKNNAEANIGLETIENINQTGILGGVKALSRERWAEKIERFYEDTALGKGATGEANQVIAKLKELMMEASGDEDARICLEGRLFHAEKDLARLRTINLYASHMHDLDDLLKTPLTTASRANITAALDLLRSHDPIICDPSREFTICFYEGTQVAALRGEQVALEGERDELAARLGVDRKRVQVWQELPLTYVPNACADRDLNSVVTAPWHGCWNIQQKLKSPLDIAGENAHVYTYLLDSGATHPLGCISDINDIDPTSQLQPAGKITLETANGIVVRTYYNLEMCIITPVGESITRWRPVIYVVGDVGQQRLSGLMAFQHTYMAKGPGGTIRMGNLKTRVASVMRAGEGDA